MLYWLVPFSHLLVEDQLTYGLANWVNYIYLWTKEYWFQFLMELILKWKNYRCIFIIKVCSGVYGVLFANKKMQLTS